MLVSGVHQQIAADNRKIIGESAIALLVGLVTCVLVFGGMFWIGYLFMWFFRPFGLRQAALASLTVTAAFAIVSLAYAWRRFDPLEDVQGMDPHWHDLQIAAGLALGVPVVNRQSTAGFASLLIGGPANLFDAWSLWRNRIANDEQTVQSVAAFLDRCQKSPPAPDVRDAGAIVILHRLGLIKIVARKDGKAEVQPTTKGLEIAAF